MPFANRICGEWICRLPLPHALTPAPMLALEMLPSAFARILEHVLVARLARRSLGGGGRTRPANLRMGWSRGWMGVAITLCDETEYERGQDKHDNALFGRGKAESLPDLIEFEAHSVFQPQINTNGHEFIKSRKRNDPPWREATPTVVASSESGNVVTF